MRKLIGTAVLSTGLAFTSVAPAMAHTHHHRVEYYRARHYYRHRRHMETLKRVGIGTAGGAVVGGLIGGAPGAGIGAIAGAGAGVLWDRHEKHHGHY